MCFALPIGSRQRGRPSRIPEPLRFVLGGMVLLGILSVSLLAHRMMPGQR